MCREAGFDSSFAGGYLTETEMVSLRRHLRRALEDPRLGNDHKDFLRTLVFDRHGLPMSEDRYAGVSGVYHLTKARAPSVAVP